MHHTIDSNSAFLLSLLPDDENILLKVRVVSIKFMKPVPIIIADKKGALHLFCIVLLILRHSIGGMIPNTVPPCDKNNTRKISRCKTVLQIFRPGDVEESSSLN